jgi:hypothetical protein
MPTQLIPLTTLVPLYRQMSSPSWSAGRLCGELRIKDQDTADLLRQLLAEDMEVDYPCQIKVGDPDNIKVGDIFELGFERFRADVGLLLPDVAALLKNSQAVFGTVSVPWYVVDRNLASWEDNEISKRIAAVKQLVSALEGSASLFDSRKNLLIFIRNGRFDVPLRINPTAFHNFDLNVLQELVTLLSLEDGHTDQRHEICATAICEMLARTPPDQRFDKILRDIRELKQRFIDGYKLFASSFSFEKIRDQAESIRIEYLGKIHKTFSDIQGQLLGIPISTIVVATQFKDVETQTGAARAGLMWINVAVLVGALIFCIFFTLAALNQKHTLDALEEEIDRHKKALENDHIDIKTRLDSIFTSLTNRATFHRCGLWIVIVICWGAFLFGVNVFWRLSAAAL